MRPGIFLAILAVTGALAAVPAAAQDMPGPGVQRLDRILPDVRRSHPGQFYDAEGPTPGADGREHYHLKWMTPDGRIEWLDTDAHTGRVLRASPGRDTFDGPGPGRSYPPAPSYPAPFEGRGDFRGDGAGRDFGGWRGRFDHDGGGRGGYGGGGWRGRRGGR